MHVPTQFARELHDTFNGRFRLRWSNRQQEFQLEQKVFTGQVIPPNVDESGRFVFDDAYERARDGYVYIMTIRQGDRMPCPTEGCMHEIHVPVMHTGEASCPIHGKVKAAFFPLNHTLIAHIRDMDPLNGGPERMRNRMRVKQLEKQKRDEERPYIEGSMQVMDNKYQVEDRPMVGFGPKTAQRHEGLEDRLT